MKPKIICLCGSTKFKWAFEEAERVYTLQGYIILTVGLFGHSDGIEFTPETKNMLDELHKRKIDLCDEVHIVNVGDYIGQSTRSEIEYAKQHGKIIRFIYAHCFT